MQELPISLPNASSESLGQETRLFWRAEAAAGAPVGSVPELPACSPGAAPQPPAVVHVLCQGKHPHLRLAS